MRARHRRRRGRFPAPESGNPPCRARRARASPARRWPGWRISRSPRAASWVCARVARARSRKAWLLRARASAERALKADSVSLRRQRSTSQASANPAIKQTTGRMFCMDLLSLSWSGRRGTFGMGHRYGPDAAGGNRVRGAAACGRGNSAEAAGSPRGRGRGPTRCAQNRYRRRCRPIRPGRCGAASSARRPGAGRGGPPTGG